MSREQFDKLKAHFEKLYPGDYSRVQYSKNSYYRFYQERLSYESFQAEHANYMSCSYTKAAECIKSTNEISFEEFDFEDEFVLPAKWCVKRDTKEKSLILSEWANKVSNTDRHEGYSDKNFIHSENVSSYSSSPRSDGKQKGFTEITFEQFKKYVLNQNNRNKKIIGYKCPTSLFGDLIKEGTVYKSTNNNLTHVYGDYIPDDKQATADRFKLPAEIVETWEPVYEEQFKAGDWVTYLPDTGGEGTHQITEWVSALYCQLSNGKAPFKVTLRKATPEEIAVAQTKTVRMGGVNGFDVKIIGKEIFQGNSPITLYVEDIYETYNSLLIPKESSKGTSYDFHPKDLIIGKTGCQNKETKLTEWLALYEMIKK